MKLGHVEANVLLTLLDSARGLHIFTLYRRLKAPLGDVIRSTLKLQELGLVSVTEQEHVSLTDEGKMWSYKVAAEVFDKSTKPWRDVPDRFKRHHENSDLDFFIPKVSLLHKNFFC